MIPHALSGLPFVERFYSKSSVYSFDDHVQDFHQRPLSPDTLIVLQADKQECTPFSQMEGILWTALFFNKQPQISPFIFTRALSVALCDAVTAQYPLAPLRINWPSEVMWAEKTIGNLELQKHPELEDVSILKMRVYVNVKKHSLPHSLSATSILAETGQQTPLSTLLHNILRLFHENRFSDQKLVHRQYLKRTNPSGSLIKVNGREGILEDIDIEGGLLINFQGTLVRITDGLGL